MSSTATLADTPAPPPVASGYWQDLATTDFARLDLQRTVALLPVSACEQHGPHLPLCTDAAINAGIVDAMLAALDPSVCVLVLPAQTIGDSIEHESFPGTLSQEMGTLVATWVALGKAVRRTGIRKLVIFNTHGGQRGHVDQAAVRLRAWHDMLVARANVGQLGKPEGLFDEDERSFGLHGGAIETSLMLHLRPDLVRRERLADFPSLGAALRDSHRLLGIEKPVGFGWMAQDLNPAGVCGDASRASAQHGARLLAHQATNLAALCAELADTPLTLLHTTR